MSKSHTAHRARVPFQPQVSTIQNREAAREDGSADHKKAAHEAKSFHGNGAHESHHAEQVADEKVEHHGMDSIAVAENGADDPASDTPYATAVAAATDAAKGNSASASDATGSSTDPHDVKPAVSDKSAVKPARKRSPRRVNVSESTEMGRGQE